MSTNSYFTKNFGYGTLNGSITVSAASMTVNSGNNFSLIITEFFKLIIWNAATYPNPADDPNLEVVTANYAGTLNHYAITRGEESTAAVAHASGAACAMTITAGLFQTNTLRNQIFLSSGTFIVPPGITQVYLSMCGAGAGGGGGKTTARGGGGGGAGQGVLRYPYTVVPGTSYTVTLNNPGNGGGDGVDGGNGGTTVFDTITMSGGVQGLSASASTGGIGYVVNATNASGGTPGVAGTGYVNTGSGGNGTNSNNGGGGGGGSSPFGLGGNGGNGGTSTAGSSATGYGAGGGGGGCDSGNGKNGGNGTKGIVMVEW